MRVGFGDDRKKVERFSGDFFISHIVFVFGSILLGTTFYFLERSEKFY
jgi:hypothetical protein